MTFAGSPARSGHLLVACALARETRLLQAQAPRVPAEFITTGMGRRRTLATLEQELPARRPAALVFSGVAGALAPGLSLGTVLFPEAWQLPNGESFSPAPGLLRVLRERGWTISGTGLTVPRPVLRPSTRGRLHARTGALICDMEAAHALQLAARLGIPALALKVVSDTAKDSLIDFWHNLDRNLEILGREVGRLLRDLSQHLA